MRAEEDGIEFGRRKFSEIARGHGIVVVSEEKDLRDRVQNAHQGITPEYLWQDVKDFVRDLIGRYDWIPNVQPDGSGAVEFSSQGDLGRLHEKNDDQVQNKRSRPISVERDMSVVRGGDDEENDDRARSRSRSGHPRSRDPIPFESNKLDPECKRDASRH